MKGKRRHELQTNVLADWLGHKVEKLRPAFRWILGGGIVAVLGILAYSFFTSRSQTQIQEGWLTLNRAKTEARNAIEQDRLSSFQPATDQMAKIVSEYKGTPLAMYASAALGDVNLQRGRALVWKRPSEAQECFGRAADHYRSALAVTDDPLLKNRLRMSLGTATQWHFQSEKSLDESKQAFHEVEKGIFRPFAEDQLASLTQAVDDKLFPAVKAFEPRPETPETKQPGLPPFGSETTDLGKQLPGGNLPTDSLDIGKPGSQSTAAAVQSSAPAVPAEPEPSPQPTAGK